MTDHKTFIAYERTCHNCGGRTCVMLPEGATELDVMAEFSSQGREVGRFDDSEGVICHGCAEAVWKAAR